MHRDKGNVNVGRLVFNLGGGGVVNLNMAWQEKAASLDNEI
ncbi:hypothetical protein HaLaN_02085 [Haematococcus lacustris]|uniref:Uncharacterized protein n=1 Tax=Haematococcus lacustris TaxID=44745 RepID=A0A699YB73_HAELA|nr:hypothetical protein HaLaN_02085 [Haematococcus lacustris]